ncbi:MAG: cytochrome c oxidase subunit 3 [Bdellovibrionales bacterium]
MPRQPFHLVEYSPWPLTGALGAIFLTSGLTCWFHKFSPYLLAFSLTIIILTILQ